MVVKTFCVGLTGGIASGKTTVSDLFKKLDVPVIDADEISHQLTQKNTTVYHEIVKHFGCDILCHDKTLDRKKLRAIIFRNSHEKKWLENYLHPLIRKIMRDEIKKIKSDYCICVIPLLTESTSIDFIDRVLVVDTSIDIQIVRAKERDNASTASIQKIIDAQSCQQARLKIADDVLVNDGDLKTLEDSVRKLHLKYVKMVQFKP